jgi:hypothetical protein
MDDSLWGQRCGLNEIVHFWRRRPSSHHADLTRPCNERYLGVLVGLCGCGWQGGSLAATYRPPAQMVLGTVCSGPDGLL